MIVSRLLTVLGLFAFALLVSVAPASAQTVIAEPDYAALVNGAKGEFYPALTTAGPIVFGVLGVMAAIGFAWRKIASAMHSS